MAQVRERAKRKRPCRCDPAPPEMLTSCGHRGDCTEWRCPQCRGLRFSAGPAWCPCDGYVRWLRYPGMRNWDRHWEEKDGAWSLADHRAHAKPSKARRFQGGRHNRRSKLYCERLLGRRG